MMLVAIRSSIDTVLIVVCRRTRLTTTEVVELPELEPGEQVVVDFDAVAPEREGTYIMTFIVEGGLCYPYTAIVVEK